jgi:uncharacterized protein (DUF885 family)
MAHWRFRVVAAALGVLAAGPVAAQDAAPGESIAAVGAEEYARLTELHTTLALTADDIRGIGRRELDRVLVEIQGEMDEVGFEGTTEEYFAFLRSDDRFYYPDTDEGRAAYLAEARRIAAEMGERLDALIEPPATLTALDAAPLPPNYPPWTTAAYASPGMRLTASAPVMETGALLFNLADMRSAPRFQIPVLSYHEGIPGHHLQLTIERAQPRLAGQYSERIPAYAEGWAAYAMQLPWELGLPQDPYANAGRLGLLSWGTARLLVDVGLAVDGWSREEAVAFLLANSALTERQARLEVERCVERPAASSVYMIGMLKFQELRARAEAVLGDEFDPREFHQVVLGQGQLTLPALENAVDVWIAEAAAN